MQPVNPLKVLNLSINSSSFVPPGFTNQSRIMPTHISGLIGELIRKRTSLRHHSKLYYAIFRLSKNVNKGIRGSIVTPLSPQNE